jgi:hypothetical protein
MVGAAVGLALGLALGAFVGAMVDGLNVGEAVGGVAAASLRTKAERIFTGASCDAQPPMIVTDPDPATGRTRDAAELIFRLFPAHPPPTKEPLFVSNTYSVPPLFVIVTVSVSPGVYVLPDAKFTPLRATLIFWLFPDAVMSFTDIEVT